MALKKALCTVLVVLIVTCVFFGCLDTSAAESTPTPSVPEFTLKLVDESYDIPAKTTVNPYTGESTTRSGSHVERFELLLSIKNQPYDPNYSFFYDIRIKGHFEEKWVGLLYPYTEYPLNEFTSDVWGAIVDIRYFSIHPSDSEYTVLSYGYGDYHSDYQIARPFPIEGQVDFSVKALIYSSAKLYPRASTEYTLIGGSDWSDTQTVTLSANNATTNSSPMTSGLQTPTLTSIPTEKRAISTQSGNNSAEPQLGWVEVVAVAALGLVAVLVVVVVVLGRRIRRSECRAAS